MIDLQMLVDYLAADNLLVEVRGNADRVYIDQLANDSRKVGPAGLFVAIKGEAADGHLFIEKAVQNGAIAIVCEAMPAEMQKYPAGVVFVQVNNARAALSVLASCFYCVPGKSIRIIGITGTNGKTTTAFLVYRMLMQMGVKTGLLSTVEYRIGEHVEEATHTTPDPLDTCRLLRVMIDAGCEACVMEVSSHALMQERVRTLPFEVGVFTNLTQDHLDYHGTMDAYLEAKKMLFDQLSEQATAVYNVDDAAGEKMIADTKAKIISYGCSDKAVLQGNVIENTLHGLMLNIDNDSRRYNLVGRFNGYNLLAAFGVGIAMGYSNTDVLEALVVAQPVPGRFEVIRASLDRFVVVDYAHTPDALENVLTTLVETKAENAKLWCVFGCGGDRDAKKRPLMGKIAEQFADFVVATSDNPRTEDPEAILNDIRAGINEPDNVHWVVDREKAIQLAAQKSGPGDVVLIAGKGHETYQVIGTTRIDFDDREVARTSFG